MNLSNIAGIMQMVSQKASQTQKTSVNGTSFADSLQKAEGAENSKVEAYTEQLRSKYGNVMIMDVGSDQNSMDNLGMGTAGTGNVVIAPNILEQMANDPEKAAYYEEKIQAHFDSLPETEAFMAAIGHKITSCGVVVHPDGKVTYYLSGEEGPEIKAKFEAAQKAKREKKAEEQRKLMEQSQEAAAERRRIAQKQYHAQWIEEMQTSHVYDSAVSFYVVSEIQKMAPAVSAYEQAISTLRNNVIKNI